jgi:hypothetical protein
VEIPIESVTGHQAITAVRKTTAPAAPDVSLFYRVTRRDAPTWPRDDNKIYKPHDLRYTFLIEASSRQAAGNVLPVTAVLRSTVRIK